MYKVIHSTAIIFILSIVCYFFYSQSDLKQDCGYITNYYSIGNGLYKGTLKTTEKEIHNIEFNSIDIQSSKYVICKSSGGKDYSFFTHVFLWIIGVFIISLCYHTNRKMTKEYYGSCYYIVIILSLLSIFSLKIINITFIDNYTCGIVIAKTYNDNSKEYTLNMVPNDSTNLLTIKSKTEYPINKYSCIKTDNESFMNYFLIFLGISLMCCFGLVLLCFMFFMFEDEYIKNE